MPIEELGKWLLLGIFLTVMLVLVIPAFTTWLEGKQPSLLCEWSVVASAMTRFGGVETIPVNCKANYVAVNKKFLNEKIPEAKRMFKIFESNPKKYQRVIEKFNEFGDRKLEEFALDSIIAKELDSCWNKVVRGKLPMFDSWWNLVDWKIFFAGDYSQFYYANDFIKSWNLGFVEVWGPPTFCIVCSKIAFTEDVKTIFKDSKIKTLEEWLHHTQHKTGTSYFEFLFDGQTYPSAIYYDPYSFSVDTQLAVIYKRVNMHQIEKVGSNIVELFGGKESVPSLVSLLRLVPYNKVARPESEGGEGCFYIID